MQQFHPNNVEQDPSRAMWNNSSDFINQNQNQNIFKKIIENNKKGKSELRDIVFNNSNRESTIENDVIEKDKEIQSLKFKLKQQEIDFNKLKKDLSIIDELKNENKLLHNKLNGEYEKNKEITILRNQLEMIKKQNTILKEKKSKTNDEEEEDEEGEEDEEEGRIEEITTDNYNYNMVFEKIMKEKEIYKNDKLKDIICKYKKGVDKNKIDTIFIEMKIDNNVEITKELITSVIMKLTK